MRFVSARHGGRSFAGVLEGDRVLPIEGLAELGPNTPFEHLAELPRTGESLALDEIELRPVIPHPRRIICLGLNYQTHIAETRRETPEYPVLFCKFASALIGANEPIVKPPESDQVDYEAELAVIIGRPARRVSVDQALLAVAGYAVANDVTVRDYQYKTHQWLQGKAWDQTTPLGPALVTTDEVGDGSGLKIELELNGERMQSASTSDLMFPVPEIIRILSGFTTLEPGDVILTGTPGGVGYRREPQVFLTAGDRVRVTIDKVGTIDNAVVAEPG